MLADELVPQIREAYAGGTTARELAAELGVNPRTIVLCVRGQTYRDLGGPISNEKGAHAAWGTRHPCAKLDEPRVLEIRAAAARGETVRSLAARHGVCNRTICQIVNWITWKHVRDAPCNVAGSSGRWPAGTVAERRSVEATVEGGASLVTLARLVDRVSSKVSLGGPVR
jgi:transposase-like protein